MGRARLFGIFSYVIGVRIVGGYAGYVKYMVDRHTQHQRVISGHKMMIIDSYDGAEHVNTSTQKIGIISFSSQLLSKSIIESGASAGSSLNILTWKQIIGQEKCGTLFPALDSVYKCKKNIIDDQNLHPTDVCFNFFEMHDAKMLYILTQHSLYNRKYHPFLLCKCHRGDGVKDRQHVCEKLTNEEQMHHYDRSKRRWDRKLGGIVSGNYAIKDHKDWCDKENVGVTHFGVDPKQLPNDHIRFDVFSHDMCNNKETDDIPAKIHHATIF